MVAGARRVERFLVALARRTRAWPDGYLGYAGDIDVDALNAYLRATFG